MPIPFTTLASFFGRALSSGARKQRFDIQIADFKPGTVVLEEFCNLDRIHHLPQIELVCRVDDASVDEQDFLAQPARLHIRMPDNSRVCRTGSIVSAERIAGGESSRYRLTLKTGFFAAIGNVDVRGVLEEDDVHAPEYKQTQYGPRIAAEPATPTLWPLKLLKLNVFELRLL